MEILLPWSVPGIHRRLIINLPTTSMRGQSFCLSGQYSLRRIDLSVGMERIPGKPECNQGWQFIATGVKDPGRFIPVIVVNLDLLALKLIRELARILLQLFEWIGLESTVDLEPNDYRLAWISPVFLSYRKTGDIHASR